MNILLANPRGFCAGVDRAIGIVERCLELFGSPIYVRHEVVHNRRVVEQLRARGAVFVDELDEVPDAATVIFSAHGVARAVEQEAKQRNLRVFDATCPLVTKVHMEVTQYATNNIDVILIGHAGHPEVEGTMGRYHSLNGGTIILVQDANEANKVQVKDPERLAFVSQTTLSVDDTEEIIKILRSRFPNIKAPRRDDICYATQNRQDAVKTLAHQVDLVLVVGSPNSSNSNRLRELAQKRGTTAYLVEDAEAIDPDWLSSHIRIGVTAGASAPEVLVQEVIARLRDLGVHEVRELEGLMEEVTFSIPVALR